MQYGYRMQQESSGKMPRFKFLNMGYRTYFEGSLLAEVFETPHPCRIVRILLLDLMAKAEHCWQNDEAPNFNRIVNSWYLTPEGTNF
jgi:hypothetical protein